MKRDLLLPTFSNLKRLRRDKPSFSRRPPSGRAPHRCYPESLRAVRGATAMKDVADQNVTYFWVSVWTGSGWTSPFDQREWYAKRQPGGNDAAAPKPRNRKQNSRRESVICNHSRCMRMGICRSALSSEAVLRSLPQALASSSILRATIRVGYCYGHCQSIMLAAS